MAELIRVGDFRNSYISLVEFIKREGEEVSPRGMPVLEVRDLIVELTDPRDAIPMGVGRAITSAIGVTETIHLMSGTSDLVQLNNASKGAFSKFSDDRFTLRGAYGPRTADRMRMVIPLLREDPDTRQAAVSVWGNHDDEVSSKDFPCTMSWVFSVRGGRLHMSTYMRSQDVWLGSPYDFWMFTRLQGAVAWCLGLELGTYTHHAASWHLYTRDIPATEKLERIDMGEPPVPMLFNDLAPEEGWTPSWNDVVRIAMKVRRGADFFEDSLTWYSERMPAGAPYLCANCGYFYPLITTPHIDTCRRGI